MSMMTSSAHDKIIVSLARKLPAPEASTQLMDTLAAHGYCYLSHPSLTPTLMKSVKQHGRRFFKSVYPKLPHPSQEGLKTNMGFRGVYRYIGAAGKKDMIDCFSIGKETDAPLKLREEYYGNCGWERHEYADMFSIKNRWDLINDATLKEIMLEYYAVCNEISMDVLRHIATALEVRPTATAEEVDTEFFTQHHDKADCNLEVKYYPHSGTVKAAEALRPKEAINIDTRQILGGAKGGPKLLRRWTKAPEAATSVDDAGSNCSGSREDGAERDRNAGNQMGDDQVLRLDSHKDLSSITLLAQDELGGLEVFDNSKDDFIPVPVLEDGLIAMNAGRFLERWTSGLIEATPHRVRCTGSKDRCSIVYFCFPNHEAYIEPLALGKEEAMDPTIDTNPFHAGDMMPMVY